MPFYEYEHIPGIDWVGKWSEFLLRYQKVLCVMDLQLEERARQPFIITADKYKMVAAYIAR